MNPTNVIPIIFATDDNYTPYLGVALASMLKNASKDYLYKIYVLETDLSKVNKDKLQACLCGNADITYLNVTKQLDGIGEKLHLRDYYTKTTYYRFFIPALLTQYNKALYLDCDIAVTGDISQLFATQLGSNLVGAAQEEVMATDRVFGEYVEQALDISVSEYFNAGVLLMNLKAFRDENIEGQFVDLLQKHKFAVTQDQDYLNVLCKNRVTKISVGWNKTPIETEGFSQSDLNLAHYKIHLRPWKYDDILYGDLFWQYAKVTPYFEHLRSCKENMPVGSWEKDMLAYERLRQLALEDINSPNNYKRTKENEITGTLEYIAENLTVRTVRVVE